MNDEHFDLISEQDGITVDILKSNTMYPDSMVLVAGDLNVHSLWQ